MKRIAAIGAALATLYVGVVVATAALSDRDVRPLFDAGAPAPPYRWVRPPPDFAPGNVAPESTEIVLGVAPEDLPPAGASEDGQFVFNLPKNAIAPAAGDTEMVARIVPIDPATLGPVPPNNYADGNAYRITLTYRPSGAPVVIGAPGSILLTVPVPAINVVLSEDGRSWRPVKNQHVSATTQGAEFPAAGYYLALTPEVIGSGGGTGGIGRLIAPVLITVLVAGALLSVPVLLRRRR